MYIYSELGTNQLLATNFRRQNIKKIVLNDKNLSEKNFRPYIGIHNY